MGNTTRAHKSTGIIKNLSTSQLMEIIGYIRSTSSNMIFQEKQLLSIPYFRLLPMNNDLIHLLDQNSDGKINGYLLLSFFIIWGTYTWEEKSQFLFQLVDFGGKGFLMSHELEFLISVVLNTLKLTILFDKPLSQEKVKTMILNEIFHHLTYHEQYQTSFMELLEKSLAEEVEGVALINIFYSDWDNWFLKKKNSIGELFQKFIDETNTCSVIQPQKQHRIQKLIQYSNLILQEDASYLSLVEAAIEEVSSTLEEEENSTSTEQHSLTICKQLLRHIYQLLPSLNLALGSAKEEHIKVSALHLDSGLSLSVNATGNLHYRHLRAIELSHYTFLKYLKKTIHLLNAIYSRLFIDVREENNQMVEILKSLHEKIKLKDSTQEDFSNPPTSPTKLLNYPIGLRKLSLKSPSSP